MEHQRKEHPGGLEMASNSNSGRDRTYCVSLAFDVLLDTLKCCFPLDQIGQTTNSSSGIVQPNEKVKAGKKATTSGTVEMAKKRRGRKRKHKDSTGTSSDDGTEIVLEDDEEEDEAEEECSWTEED